MKRIILNLMVAACVLGSTSLMAQSVTVGSNSGVRGQVVVIPLNFNATGTPIGSFTVDVSFDGTKFSAASGTCFAANVGGSGASCTGSAASNNLRIQVSGNGTDALTSGLAANLSFTIDNAAPFGAVPLDGIEVVAGFVDGSDDFPLGTLTAIDGTLTILGPLYASTPAAGALNVGSVVQNGTDPSVNVVINNTSGATGTTLTGTCSETADPDGVFSLSGDTSFSVPQAGPTDTVTVTCDSAGSIANHTGTMSCSHNGTNTSPQVYNLSCDITAGPQPSFNSVPAPGVITLGPVDEGAAAPTQNISISNNGDPATTLTGTCAMGAGDTEITLTSDGSYSVLQGGAADLQTVSCSTAAEGSYSRTLTCPHNGSNGPNAVFTVDCTIDPPPAPEYSSVPAIGSTLDFGGVATEEGDPNPEDSISISNIGDTGSQLDVTCTDTVDPDGVFSVVNGVINNLLPTGGSPTVTVTCDASAQGSYSGTLSCDHNGETATDPATYLLECAIGPPGAAIFNSIPAPDSIINLTPSPVAQGTDVTPLPLVFQNLADPGDSDLEIQCVLSGDAPPISSVGTDFGPGVDIPGASSATAQFDCDTTNIGTYSATYNCGYNTFSEIGVDATQGDYQNQAVYTVECEVREPISDVEPEIPSGTPQQALVQPGGSHTFSFTFDEVADEGVDAQLEECTLDTGAEFSILSPTFPALISAGGSVTVQVQGTDPGGVDEFSDTLRCIYSDSNNPYNGDNELGVEVVYPLTIIVGGDATFRVTKEFTDGQNPTLVDVTISCFTGLPLIQSQTISETQDVNFVVTSFDSGELDCEITEDLTELVGYTPTYYPTGENVDSDGGCNFHDVTGGSENFCHIVNDADPVDVVIEKVWVIDGVGGDQIDQTYKLTLYCDTTEEEESPQSHGCQNGDAPVNSNGPSYGFCQEFHGNGSQTFIAHVEPDYPTTNCWVEETVYDSSVEVHNGCENLVISAGQGASCVITNTVFFEGIPTLSQYGMAILALLMLGVGLVGFRRFA